MKKMKVIIVVIVAAVCIGLAITIIINRDPNRVFTKIYGFKLPDSDEFIAYNISANSFSAKILVNNNDVDTIIQGLNNHFGSELRPDVIVNWGNSFPWWDLDENKIIARYYSLVDRQTFLGLASTSGSEGALLTENDNGQYYLYLKSF